MSVSWKCWFWGEGKTGVSGEKPLGARKRTNDKLNPRVALTPWFQPGPTLVPRARRFLVGYKLSRVALGTRMNPGHTAGRQVLSPLHHPCSPQSYISIKEKLCKILEYDVSYVEGDALIDKIRLTKLTFLRARATLKKNTITAPVCISILFQWSCGPWKRLILLAEILASDKSALCRMASLALSFVLIPTSSDVWH